jgi:glycosyltransferase involved in cell wall biosynthesis
MTPAAILMDPVASRLGVGENRTFLSGVVERDVWGGDDAPDPGGVRCETSLLGDAESEDTAGAVVSQVQSKPSLLYICAVIPAISGNGLAMRGGMVLEALSELYRVSLLVVPNSYGIEREVPEVLRAKCENVAIVPRNPIAEDRIEEASRVYRGHKFDIVHVFRLAALPFSRFYFNQVSGRARIHLDLDDIESKTYRRIAALHRNAGNAARALVEEGRAQQAALLETYAFRTFDRIYVCSEPDRRELLERCRAEIRVLKNAVRAPAIVRPAKVSQDFRFLFVGTFGYYPNEDAVYYFCRQVLPLIRDGARTSFQVHFVGANASRNLLELAAGDDVEIVGAVADVQPWYESSHAVIVPLRAGGGTRIKILEAFSYQRPVITTSIGVEGIDAEPNRHVLVADPAETFASACLQLMSDRPLAEYLVQNATSLLTQSYSIDALKKSAALL